MIKVITYHSINSKLDEAWIAYPVLPNGDIWQIRFVGETEEIAIAKAISLYEAERAKSRGGKFTTSETF